MRRLLAQAFRKAWVTSAVPAVILAHLYQLTPAESAVVRELVLGRSVEEIAERLRITLHTARTHIKRILSKTGTRRQADVIRLILLSCCR